MKRQMRYDNRMTTRYRSGTRRAKRRQQLICALAALVVCGLVSIGYYALASRDSEEKNPGVQATPTVEANLPGQEANSQATLHNLYTDAYREGLSEDDIWMEDFEDTRERTDVKAMYLTTDVINRKFDYVLELLDTTELNAVVIDIKNDDGFITVQTDSELLNSMTNTNVLLNNAEKVIKTFKEHDVYLIARVVCFRDIRSVRSNESYGVKMKDGTLMKDSSGYTWMNPLNEETWEYLTEVGRQCVAMGFDEVNFDYCRFSTDSKVKEADFGVEELTTEIKYNAITGFVKYACEHLKPLGAFVSVDVFGVVLSSEIDAAAVGQDYATMSSYLDYICPMVYPSHYGRGYYNLPVPDAAPYELIYNAMLDSKDSLSLNVAKGRCADVRPWLQAFTATWVRGHIDYGPKELRLQIDATYDAGYTGWLLWNAAGAYSTYKDGLLPQE